MVIFPNPKNIIVRIDSESRVTGIQVIDWETGGFYAAHILSIAGFTIRIL
jgi:hypothetical protein